jgi:hypothetical protein
MRPLEAAAREGGPIRRRRHSQRSVNFCRRIRGEESKGRVRAKSRGAGIRAGLLPRRRNQSAGRSSPRSKMIRNWFLMLRMVKKLVFNAPHGKF